MLCEVGSPDGAGRDVVALGFHVAFLLGFGVAAMVKGEALLGSDIAAQLHLHWRCILPLGDDLHTWWLYSAPAGRM